jgi:hypothetical protein
LVVGAGREIDVHHGFLDVFAFQEALLIEAVFGVALLTMIWVGFRRWLRQKERLGRLVAEQTALLAAQHGAQMERVEARLNAIEQNVTGGGTAMQINVRPPKPLADPISEDSEVCPKSQWQQ